MTPLLDLLEQERNILKARETIQKVIIYHTEPEDDISALKEKLEENYQQLKEVRGKIRDYIFELT